MKRRIIVFVIIFMFNLVLIKGINMTNNFIFAHDYFIYINEVPTNQEEKENENKEEEEKVTNTTYNGESASKIGKKLDKYFKKTEISGFGEFIAQKSINKNVNPYLIGSIILEDSKCNVKCDIVFTNCKNVGETTGTPGCFGGKYKKYDKYEDSIIDLINYISSSFTLKQQTPNGIYKKLGKDIAWAYKVSKDMETIKKTK